MSIVADEIMAYIQGYLDEAPDEETTESILSDVADRVRDLHLAQDPLRENLAYFTVEGAAAAAGRLPTRGEIRAIVKALPYSSMPDAFTEVVQSIVSMPDDDVDGTEGRAGDVLKAGVIYREIGGLDEWECVRTVDQHGDTVLVTTWGGNECSYDRDEVIETTTITEED